jgi:hypothetical protein
MTSRHRKIGRLPKKRRSGRSVSARRPAKRRRKAPSVPSSKGPAPAHPDVERLEPPPIIPQPSLDSPEEEPSEPEEPRQEPPPPSASANARDGDDLFEYVF